MRIIEIQVRGLFGTFDHTLPLTNPDRVTIIHGPNGFGKTVMLRMTASLIDRDTTVFERVPFTEFGVLLDDMSRVTIRHLDSDPGAASHDTPKLEVLLTDSDGVPRAPAPERIATDIPSSVLDDIDRIVPGPYARHATGWRIPGEPKVYSLAEIVSRFPALQEALPTKYVSNPFACIPRELQVFFVQTTRLDAEHTPSKSPTSIRHLSTWAHSSYRTLDDVSVASDRPTLRVDQYSRDIVLKIKSALADYARHSQESDRTFPERLVRFVRSGQHALPERQILDKMTELESKRQRLISLGFLDSETGLRDLSEDDVQRASAALTIYVQDVERKLAVFDDLAERVGKLTDIVSARFMYKAIAIDRERGISIRTDAGDEIGLASLSSGEQHELVVLYELLFRAPRAGLVLVDEPELSLHVAWQSRFLPDLMDILRLTDSYAVVATHSPTIIGARWDLAVELAGRRVVDTGAGA